MPDSADPVAAALEQIRADHEAANYFGALADDPVPRLLAAVEAALELAASLDAKADCLFAEATATPSDTAMVFAAGGGGAYKDFAGSLRGAVSRALLGEEPADGQSL